jgi:transcriptional regulator with XRE-family HTH domain
MSASARNSPSLRRAFGARVRQLRKSRGLTQIALAAVCKLDRTYIGGIERGEQNPTLECIAEIAKSLGVTVAGLVAEVDKQYRSKARGST